MKKYILIAWCTALIATVASVYFIEILGKPAASLCWFERMLMFGLLMVLTIGFIKKDLNVKYYAIPFLLFGIPSALYQQLVHWNVISVVAQPCSISVVCTTKFFELFGFVTQATLCLGAFVVIAFCLSRLKTKKSKH